jgi:hypothetical protein
MGEQVVAALNEPPADGQASSRYDSGEIVEITPAGVTLHARHRRVLDEQRQKAASGRRSAASASGTRRYRPTDRGHTACDASARRSPAARLALFTAFSSLAPVVHPLRLDIVVAGRCAADAAVLLCGPRAAEDSWDTDSSRRARGLAAALFLTYLGWLPGANVAKASRGERWGCGWRRRSTSLASSWSPRCWRRSSTPSAFTAAGPTPQPAHEAPQVVGYFTVAMTWFGYSYRDAYSAIGTSDLVFFSLYLGAVLQFRLRVTLTVIAMTASFLLTVVLALWTWALPALPLLSAAFLLANADLLWRRWGERTPR